MRPSPRRIESRTLLSLTVQLNYSLDLNNFFDTAAKRDVLEAAADEAVSHYGDHLSAINPSLLNTWTAVISNPATGNDVSFSNLDVPSDTLVVFVGGRNISALGVGGPGGFSSSGGGDWNDIVASRGQSNTSGSNAAD